MALNYQIDVSFNPPNPIPGRWVEATVQVNNTTDDIRSVYASVADYDFNVYLQKSADNTYATRFVVPWEADAGQYTVILWAVSSTGEAGPRVNIPVTVHNA